MKLKLQDIATINSGHTIRGRVDNDPLGDCAVIQMRDLDVEKHQLKDTSHRIKKQEVPQSQLLKSGDIIFLSKGANNYAFVYRKDYAAVATSVFLVVRPNQERVSPEYLQWYLNQNATQIELQGKKEHSTVTNITKKTLEEITIKVPSIQTQKKLVNLYQLWEVEKEKTQKLIEMKDRYYNNLVLEEIEREYEVEPFTDDANLWRGYEHAALYYIAIIRFKESLFLKGETKPQREIHAIITHMDTETRTVANPSGRGTIGYSAVKGWNFFKFSKLNLDKWNGLHVPHIPEQQVREEILNTIPHSLIESITMVDRFGNPASNNYPTNSNELSQHDTNFY